MDCLTFLITRNHEKNEQFSILRTKFGWKNKMNLQVLGDMVLTLYPMDCKKSRLIFIFWT